MHKIYLRQALMRVWVQPFGDLCKNLGLSRHVCIVFFPAQPIAMFKLNIC
jgi:hypothetical protein